MHDGDEDSPALAHFGHVGEARPTIVDGDGATVVDADGTEYLDFTSQLYCVNAGHSNDVIRDRMGEQLGAVQYVSSTDHNDVRTRFAERLLDVAPGAMDSVFFSVSGSDANEAAIQLARAVQDGDTVLSRWRSYHGSTYATAGLTGDPAMRVPLEGGAATTGAVKFLPPFDGCDAPFDADSPAELAERAADHLEYAILNHGPDDVAALLTEVVAGSSGAFTPPPGYFDRVRAICDRYDVLLIVDEVITGFGRCGDWFGADTEDLTPDVVTFAKGATSAYVPLAGVLASEAVTDLIHEADPAIGQTFAGNPIGCAAGLGALDVYEDLIPRVSELAPHLRKELAALERFDVVGDVRGRGFLWGVAFVDPASGDPVFDPRVQAGDNPVTEVIHETRDRGVMVGSGRPGFQVMVAPPLCATEAELTAGVETLEAAVEAVFG
jgi:taurine--2-oxoglutarate transaminase